MEPNNMFGASRDERTDARTFRARSNARKGAPLQPTKACRCDICGAQFSRQTILNEHIRAQHLQERVNCTICGQPFKRQNDRRRHETFQHLRKRAFQCKSGNFGCGKRFTRLDSLKEHQSSPRKAGTTCEQAMLYSRAAVVPTADAPPKNDAPEVEASTSTSPTTDAGIIDERVRELDAGFPPSSKSDGGGLPKATPLVPCPAKDWRNWQMDLPPKKEPDYTTMPANISWPSVHESRLRHTATELAVSLTASAPPVAAMPALQQLVGQQELPWTVPEVERLDETGMWSSWSWLDGAALVDMHHQQQLPQHAPHPPPLSQQQQLLRQKQ